MFFFSVLPEGPRAFAVTQTGEKHSLHLDESLFNVNNPFSVTASTNVTPVGNVIKASNMTNVTNVTNTSITNATADESHLQMTNTGSVTKIPSITIERPRINSAKRSKVCWNTSHNRKIGFLNPRIYKIILNKRMKSLP